ncbi:MAG: hypothetical protein ACREOK_02775 [Gemmatimonadaceae bacterium]
MDYSGGLLNRNIRAYFRTEDNSYVMIGHLGGDGRIRVLFPETPDDAGFIRGKRLYRTTSLPAYYDAIPSLFSYRMAAMRGMGARFDSYDGRGHGYVFMISSDTPLRYRMMYDYGGWAEWEVDEYDRAIDPRYAVRSFADMLAGGAKYTLKFASSGTTSAYTSYASRAWDCSYLSGLGLMGHGTWFSAWQAAWLGFGSYSSARYCGEGFFPQFALGRRPVFTTATLPTRPPGEPAPDLDRPGRRGFGPRETPTRSAFGQLSPNAETAMPFDDRTPRGRRVSPRYGDDAPRRGAASASTERRREARARESNDRVQSPRATRSSRSGDSGSSAGSSASTRSSGASSSSGSRSGSQPSSSPRETRGSSKSGERRPDSR